MKRMMVSILAIILITLHLSGCGGGGDSSSGGNSGINSNPNRSTISGYVKDSAGIAISGAKVTLTDMGGFTFLTAFTDSNGYYSGSNTPTSVISSVFKVEKAGYTTYTDPAYTFGPGQTYTKNISLF